MAVMEETVAPWDEITSAPPVVHIAGSDFHRLDAEARRAMIGGRSRVRLETTARQDHLHEDQLVGLLGAGAVSKMMFGSLDPLLTARWYANLYPMVGDGGSDFPNCRVDVKSSLMRASKDPRAYRLAVRPRERHRSTVYVLALVREIHTERAAVIVPGWATDEELPSEPEAVGTFKGAFTLRAEYLHPLMPIVWG